MGQMACVGVKWGLLAIWTPQETYIEEIPFDQLLWKKWLEKLDAFWRHAQAPELVDPRVSRIPPQPIRAWCFKEFYDKKNKK